MKNAKVLVVGGAGYIGSHMVKMLACAGHKVTVFDNLSRGHRDAVKAGELVQGDLRVRDDLERLFGSRSFDLVMHFAALAYVDESVEQPLLYYENNVAGTVNLLETMIKSGVKKFLFSSTCATYGEPQEVPITEGHPQVPINPYGCSKSMVEQILRDCAQAHGLESVALRYFNAAGCDPQGQLGEKHDPETHLIPLVLREALRIMRGGDPAATMLQVYGKIFDTPDGTCIRDYVHVNDLCTAHLLAAERLIKGLIVGDEAYNLGNGRGFSVLEVIDTCRRITGIEIPYKTVGRRPGDPAFLVGCADKAHKFLGWQPEFFDLGDIIQTAWNWVRQQNGDES